MSELWIVCGIVFAGVVLGVQALYRLVIRAQRDRSAISRRLASNAGGGAKIASLSTFFVRSVGSPILIIPDWWP